MELKGHMYLLEVKGSYAAPQRKLREYVLEHQKLLSFNFIINRVMLRIEADNAKALHGRLLLHVVVESYILFYNFAILFQ